MNLVYTVQQGGQIQDMQVNARIRTQPPQVVIESPFGSKDPAIVEENKKYLDQCIADSLELGEAPYASHKLYPGALDDNIPLQREKGMAAGFAWGEKAEYVAVYVDRGISNGMVEGIKRAEANGLHVEFRSLKLERRLG